MCSIIFILYSFMNLSGQNSATIVTLLTLMNRLEITKKGLMGKKGLMEQDLQIS